MSRLGLGGYDAFFHPLFLGKFTPEHPLAMSDAPCWQNEVKGKKGESNASYPQKWLINKTYDMCSASQNQKNIYITHCKKGVQAKNTFSFVSLPSFH